MGREAKRQMLRAAIVGLGWWGRNLVESVQGKTDEIGFTACCTRSPRKATEFCARHSIALVDSYDAILRDKTIDAVVLATPPSALTPARSSRPRRPASMCSSRSHSH
jgi:predicted dehydrogenase